MTRAIEPTLPNPSYLRPHAQCKECPFRYDSVRGYFGPYDAQTYWNALHGDGIIQCHMTTPLRADQHRHCTGAALARHKVCKWPHSDLQRAHQERCVARYGTSGVLGWEFRKWHYLDDPTANPYYTGPLEDDTP
jgi:hypothetical protein